VVFDIDYRPNLWGLAGHAAGFERYVKSDRVSASAAAGAADCDLIVGTEEEIMIAGGADSWRGAARSARCRRRPIVLKRGANGLHRL
jgi:5-dehydro-2-deoxygluconokinase